MTVDDYVLVVDAIDERCVETCPASDLADADRLICDLAALVDAGLVVVEPHVLGPARYAVPRAQLDGAV